MGRGGTDFQLHLLKKVNNMKDEALKSLVSQRNRLVQDIEDIKSNKIVASDINMFNAIAKLVHDKESLLLSVNGMILVYTAAEDY